MPKVAAKPPDPEQEPQPAAAPDEFVDTCEHHPKYKTGQMRQRRVFERLEPGRGAPAVGNCEMIGIENEVEHPRDHAEAPDTGHFGEVREQAGRALPSGYPGKSQIVCALGRHGPRRRVEKGGDLRDPALQQERRKNHAGPEHGVGVGHVFAGDIAPGKNQTKKVDGIEAGESCFPKVGAA